MALIVQVPTIIGVARALIFVESLFFLRNTLRRFLVDFDLLRSSFADDSLVYIAHYVFHTLKHSALRIYFVTVGCSFDGIHGARAPIHVAVHKLLMVHEM